MSDSIEDWTQDIHQGDAAETLAAMPESSVHMCMTSPPYFGLRDYSADGQIGLEDSLDEYISELVAVGEELRRVLRDDGSWWLNLGDSYAGTGTAQPEDSYKETVSSPPPVGQSLGHKNKMLVPHRVAIALQESGWVVRNDVTWCLSATTKVYARTQKREGPMMVKDIARLDPSTVELWNGQQWTQVVNFFENPSPDETLRLTLRNGQRIDCTADHKWPTDDGIVQAGDLSEGDALRETALPEPDDCREPVHLPDRDIGWFVGMYLAEGSRGKGGDQIQIASHTDETERFSRLRKIAQAYDGHCQMHDTDGNSASIDLHGEVLTGIIDRYIGGSSADRKRLLPRCWMRGDEFLNAVLRGYLAGDGHHDQANNRWRLGFTRNDRLADDLRTLCARLGYQIRLQRTTVDGHKAYNGEIRFEKNRSANTLPDAEIVDISGSPCRTFYDIEVADEPHLFALASGVLTHNCKPNPMPSSVKDRLNTTTEQVFHLTPEPDYWYDLDAIREPHAESTMNRADGKVAGARTTERDGNEHLSGGLHSEGTTRRETLHPAGKNPGDVFEVTTKPFPEAHFAVYPPELCETPIKATCPPQVCADCGAPYEREVSDRSAFNDGECVVCGGSKSKHRAGGKSESSVNSMRRPGQQDSLVACSNREIEGWSQACDCATDATEPGIALDPFAGAGTTCMVAKRLGRRFVGVDLNAEYVAMAQKRVGVTVDEPGRLLDDDETALTAFTDGGGGR